MTDGKARIELRLVRQKENGQIMDLRCSNIWRVPMTVQENLESYRGARSPNLAPPGPAEPFSAGRSSLMF